MNSVKIERGKSINAPKRIYNVFFLNINTYMQDVYVRKIVYLIFVIHKYLPLYMYRYTDKVTKMYKHMHMYTHPQYTLTYIHLGLHIYKCTYIHTAYIRVIN